MSTSDVITFGQVRHESDEEDDMDLPEELRGTLPEGPANPFEREMRKEKQRRRMKVVEEDNELLTESDTTLEATSGLNLGVSSKSSLGTGSKIQSDLSSKDIIDEAEEFSDGIEYEDEGDDEGEGEDDEMENSNEEKAESLPLLDENLKEEIFLPKRENIRTADPTKPVDIDMGMEGITAIAPKTIPMMFQEAALRNPKAIAIKMRYSEESLKCYTYQEYLDFSMQIARALTKIGVFPQSRVSILGHSCPKWLATCLGTIIAGSMFVGMDPIWTVEECQEALSACGANLCIVEDMYQFEKIYQVWPDVPHLNAIVIWRGQPLEKLNRVYSWSEFLLQVDKITPKTIDIVTAKQRPNFPAGIVLTCGSTGKRKAPILTHDNIIWTVQSLCESYKGVIGPQLSVMSYLPLATAQVLIIDIFLPIVCGGTTYIARKDVWQGSLNARIKESQPTLFYGLPGTWMRLLEKIDSSENKGAIEKKLDEWAKKKSLEKNYSSQKKEGSSLSFGLADILVLKKAREAIGLKSCKLFLIGSDSAPPELLEYFTSIDIPIREVYGLAESSGFASVNGINLDQFKERSIGREMTGVAMKIGRKDSAGNGEILVKGRNVFSGYYGDEEGTALKIDDDGWLHTGDVGQLDEDGFYRLLARSEDILVTTVGEFVFPGPIEEVLRSFIPFAGYVALVGRNKKYLTCLLTFKCALDPETNQPLDQLSEDALAAMQSMGKDFTKPSDILDAEDEQISQVIIDAITRYNQAIAISYNQKILKFHILESDLSAATGELGPNGKLKRDYIVEKYKEEIDMMYGDS